MLREQVHLQPGKPEVIALKFMRGKEYEHRVMFTTTDNRILYVANEDVPKLERLGVAKEAQFFIRQIGMNGKQPSMTTAIEPSYDKADEFLDQLEHDVEESAVC